MIGSKENAGGFDTSTSAMMYWPKEQGEPRGSTHTIQQQQLLGALCGELEKFKKNTYPKYKNEVL